MYRAVVIGGEASVDRCVSHKLFMSHEELRRTPRWVELGFDKDEQDFLADADAFLGFSWREVLAPVFQKTPLDIYGVDFGTTREGRPIVFEVNAAMNLFSPAVAKRTPYLSGLYSHLNDVTAQYLRDRIASG